MIIIMIIIINAVFNSSISLTYSVIARFTMLWYYERKL